MNAERLFQKDFRTKPKDADQPTNGVLQKISSGVKENAGMENKINDNRTKQPLQKPRFDTLSWNYSASHNENQKEYPSEIGHQLAKELERNQLDEQLRKERIEQLKEIEHENQFHQSKEQER